MQQNDLIAQNLGDIEHNAGVTSPATLGGFIGKVLPYIFSITAILLLIYLVMGGFQLMTSQGDPKGMQGGQAKITNALIGFAIVFVAYGLVALLGKVLGVTIFADIFK